MKEIERLRQVPVFQGKFGTFYNDEVRGPKGESRYSCWMPAYAGVCVIPRRGASVGLSTVYRYPVQRHSVEVPRGLVDEGEEAASAAAREMQEETGFEAIACRHLGKIYADTGLIMRHIEVFVCDVGERRTTEHDGLELIGNFRWLEPAALRTAVAAGEIRCGITLAALMLLECASK